MSHLEQVCCPHCHYVVGNLVEYGGQLWLATETVIVRNIGGVCKRCHEPFYWSASDRMLSELVKITLALRVGDGV